MVKIKKLLRVDADPQVRHSLARGLTDEFIDYRLKEFPNTQITVRDLASDPLPQITSDEDVGALYAPPETHTPEMARLAALSDKLCQEVFDADELVINTTMYNMTVPSILKAYIDLMARGRKTFRFTASGPVGLVHGKKVLFIVTKGGIYSKGPQRAEDYLEPYLRSIFAFIGIRDSTFVTAEGLAIDEQTRQKAVANARASLVKYSRSW